MNQEKIESDLMDLWNRARQILISSQLSSDDKEEVERHLSMIKTVTSDGQKIVVSSQGNFSADMLRKEYSEKLLGALKLAGSKDIVDIEFRGDALPDPKPPLVVPSAKTSAGSNFISSMQLSSDYTFEEFVRGPSNSFAYYAAQGVVKNPGQKSYNPLFIYGGTGLGKTHIMHAIGNALRKKDPCLAICYLTSEKFLNEYYNALSDGRMSEFQNRYRRIDVLLVDDIQFIGQKNQFQEEFFNTFQTLQSEGKQIVLTSDVAPKDLPNMEKRLISRFEGGMVQEIELPSYETRFAILQKKCEALHAVVDESVLQFIAQNIKSHVRAMEGALGKVNMYLMNQPGAKLNHDTLSYLLKDLIEKENRRNLTIEEVQSAVANKYNVTMVNILSTDRTQSLVTPRQLAMFISRKFTNKSLLEIAKKFEKSHATVVHGIKQIQKRLDVESDLKNSLMEIISEFGLTMDDMY